MPDTPQDIVNRELRENKRYTGDGLSGEPVNAPLPVGDPASGVWNPKKANLRKAMLETLEGAGEHSEEWAQSDDPISEAAGGDGTTDRSSKWHADRSETAQGLSEVAQAASEDARDVTLAARDDALDYSNDALVSQTIATAAALAAQGQFVDELTDPVPAEGTIELLPVEAGVQIWKVTGGAWAMPEDYPWLGRVKFPTRTALLAFTGPLGSEGTSIEAGSDRYEVAADAAIDADEETAGDVKLYEAGPQFTSVPRFEKAVARGQEWPTGAVVRAGSRVFSKNGDNDIPTLPGWTERTVAMPDGWQPWDYQDDSVRIRTDTATFPDEVFGPLWANTFTVTAPEIITDLYEPLRADHPDYVTRTLLGNDQSDTYDIWRYDFVPPVYEKTIVIAAAVHGGEVNTSLALARFLHHVCNDWQKYPQLAYLRHRVRMIVIPVGNPWGVSQSPRTRQNSSGVDIERNTAYRWDAYPVGEPWDHDYKGTAPWSEVETQYIRDVLAEFSDAIAFVDIHDFGGGGPSAPAYVAKEFPNATTVIREVQEACRESASEDVALSFTYMPALYCWAAHEHGMYTVAPEWADTIWGTPSKNNESFRRQVKYYGNLILRFARMEQRAPSLPSLRKRTIYSYWLDRPAENDPVMFTNTSLAPINFLLTRLEGTMTPAIVRVTGVAMLTADQAATLRAGPFMYQFGSPGFGGDDPIDGTSYNNSQTKLSYVENSMTIAGSGEVVAIPFVGAFPIFPEKSGVGIPGVGLNVSTSGGTGRLIRYRAMIEIEPTDLGDAAFTIFNANGRETEGAGAMEVQWPMN